MRQNGPVSQWAGIETGDDASTAPRSAPSARPTRVVPRLRRSERIIVGAIDGGAHVLQRRGRDLLLGSAVLMVPMVALYVGLSVLAYRQFDRLQGLVGERSYVGVERGPVMVAVAVQSLTAHLVGAYAALYVVRHQMGGEPRMRTVLAAVGRRLPVLAATWLLMRGVPLLLVALVYLNTGSEAVVGLALLCSPIIALVVAWTLCLAPVVMCEPRGVNPFTRARRLVGARLGAVYAFVWGSTLMSAALFAGISALPALARSTKLVTFGSLGWLVDGLAAQLALLVVLPFSAVATAQMYLQLRVHAEGLDIALAADRAFGAGT